MNLYEEITDNLEEKEIVNPEDKEYSDGHLMKVCLYSGAGYSLEIFYVYVNGDNAEEALEIVVAYCEEKGYWGLITPVDELEKEVEETYKDEFAEYQSKNPGSDSFDFITNYLNYIYVDATEFGASKPYFVLGDNLIIENVE